MRIVVALGGNALARRGEPMTADHLRANVRSTCEALGLARQHELVITHGNGPQVGLLALQNLAYQDVAAYPLDILGAETQGMIGYVIQQELSNALAGEREVAAIVTTTDVDEADPAFERPTKLIGPQYSAQDAAEAAAEYRWTIARDGVAFRRVVPSPAPRRIVQAPLVRMLLENGQARRVRRRWRRTREDRRQGPPDRHANRGGQGPRQRGTRGRAQGGHAGHAHGRGLRQ